MSTFFVQLFNSLQQTFKVAYTHACRRFLLSHAAPNQIKLSGIFLRLSQWIHGATIASVVAAPAPAATIVDPTICSDRCTVYWPY